MISSLKDMDDPQQSSSSQNLGPIRRIDPFADQILCQGTYVAMYSFNVCERRWEAKDVCGPFFIYRRISRPYYSYIIANRQSLDDLVQPIKSDMRFELSEQYVFINQSENNITCLWFSDKSECSNAYQLLNTLRLIVNEKKDPKMSKFGGRLSDYYVDSKTRIQEDGHLNERAVEAFQFEEDEAIQRQKKLDAVSSGVDFDSLARLYAKGGTKKTRIDNSSPRSRVAPTLTELRKLRRAPIAKSNENKDTMQLQSTVAVQVTDEWDNSQQEILDLGESDDRRNIGYKIKKNKGIVAKRKKGTEHSRIKRRLQYKKAVHRRRSQVPEVRREMTKYGGEARGIRSATVKSIKFKA